MSQKPNIVATVAPNPDPNSQSLSVTANLIPTVSPISDLFPAFLSGPLRAPNSWKAPVPSLFWWSTETRRQTAKPVPLPPLTHVCFMEDVDPFREYSILSHSSSSAPHPVPLPASALKTAESVLGGLAQYAAFLSKLDAALGRSDRALWIRNALYVAAFEILLSRRKEKRRITCWFTGRREHTSSANLRSTLEKHAHTFGCSIAELYFALHTGAMHEIASHYAPGVVNGVLRDIEYMLLSARTKDIDCSTWTGIVDKESKLNQDTQLHAGPGSGSVSHTVSSAIQGGLTTAFDPADEEEVSNLYEYLYGKDERPVASDPDPDARIVAVSYRHSASKPRMSKISFTAVALALQELGVRKVQLWLDRNVAKSDTTFWAPRGLLPYTVLPVLIVNDEKYENGSDRMWISLEREAGTDGGRLFYVHGKHAKRSFRPHGDGRLAVAVAILMTKYNVETVTYKKEEVDLQKWAHDFINTVTARSFLGIGDRLLAGVIPPVTIGAALAACFEVDHDRGVAFSETCEKYFRYAGVQLSRTDEYIQQLNELRKRREVFVLLEGKTYLARWGTLSTPLVYDVTMSKATGSSFRIEEMMPLKNSAVAKKHAVLLHAGRH